MRKVCASYPPRPGKASTEHELKKQKKISVFKMVQHMHFTYSSIGMFDRYEGLFSFPACFLILVLILSLSLTVFSF